ALLGAAARPGASQRRGLSESGHGRGEALRGRLQPIRHRTDRDRQPVHRAEREGSGGDAVSPGVAELLDGVLSPASGHSLRLREGRVDPIVDPTPLRKLLTVYAISSPLVATMSAST